jgi:FixJ family two-component response regulator
VDGSNHTIVVVEDDPEVRQLLVSELEELVVGDRAVVVRSASNGNAALAVLAEVDAAVVLTDIRMPELDGVELMRELKQRDSAIEVILITGHATVETAAEAVRLGAFDYLTKPFDDLSVIGERVSAALDRVAERLDERQQRRELETDQRSLTQLLDALPMAALLLDSAGRVRKLNRSAQLLLDGADALRLDTDGRPTAQETNAREQLEALLAQATGDEATAGAMSIPRVPTGAPLHALVSPLTQAAESPRAAGSVIALLVSDPTQDHDTADELVAQLYRLTPAEARLAAELMQGKNLETAAYTLGISSHTARTHLKRVFAKTRTTRQGELISVLLSGPALLTLPRR